MKPNALKNYRPDPAYLRALLAEVKPEPVSIRGAARLLRVSAREMRRYFSVNPNDHRDCPYTVQLGIEALAGQEGTRRARMAATSSAAGHLDKGLAGAVAHGQDDEAGDES